MRQITALSVGTLVPSPTNPRKDFGDLKELGASLKKHGALQPIVVRKHPKNGGKFEVVCGERRFRAAKLVGLDTIDSIVREMTDLEVREVQHVENIQREDVSPLDQAVSFHELMKIDPKKYSVDGLAEMASISRRSVYVILQLVKLSDAIQALMREGAIDTGHAVLLAPLALELQDRLAKQMDEQFKRHGAVTSVRELKRTIQTDVLRNLSAAPFDTKDPTLSPKFGPCTTCRFNTSVDPEAYPDEPKDRCMNPDDYEVKMTVFLSRKAAELEAEAKKANTTVATVIGSGAPHTQEEAARKKYGGKVLKPWDYREVKATAAGAKKALVVAGAGRGTVKYISTTKEAPRQPSKAEKVQRSKENLQQRARALAKRNILTAILSKTKASADTLRKVAQYCIERSYDSKGVIKTLGWVDEGTNGSKYDEGFTKPMEAALAKLSVDQLAATALLAILFTDDPYADYASQGEHLKAEMKARKIDPKQFLKDAERQLAARKIEKAGGPAAVRAKALKAAEAAKRTAQTSAKGKTKAKAKTKAKGKTKAA
jgi:ParB/RepB/Spo0J family partition protein